MESALIVDKAFFGGPVWYTGVMDTDRVKLAPFPRQLFISPPTRSYNPKAKPATNPTAPTRVTPSLPAPPVKADGVGALTDPFPP